MRVAAKFKRNPTANMDFLYNIVRRPSRKCPANSTWPMPCTRAIRKNPVKIYTWPGSTWRPSACEADVIATRPQVLGESLWSSSYSTAKTNWTVERCSPHSGDWCLPGVEIVGLAKCRHLHIRTKLIRRCFNMSAADNLLLYNKAFCAPTGTCGLVAMTSA